MGWMSWLSRPKRTLLVVGDDMIVLILLQFHLNLMHNLHY